MRSSLLDGTVALRQALQGKIEGMPKVVGYKRYCFRPEIIAHAAWLYFRFALGLQLIEDMLLKRSIVVPD
jgi:transposase-like protein